MRIRGKKPWALINRKIVRFKAKEDYDDWFRGELREAVIEAEEPGPKKYYTMDEVREHLHSSAKNRAAYVRVTRRSLEKRIKRRRLWPA